MPFQKKDVHCWHFATNGFQEPVDLSQKAWLLRKIFSQFNSGASLSMSPHLPWVEENGASYILSFDKRKFEASEEFENRLILRLRGWNATHVLITWRSADSTLTSSLVCIRGWGAPVQQFLSARAKKCFVFLSKMCQQSSTFMACNQTGRYPDLASSHVCCWGYDIDISDALWLWL